jgi:cell division protein FtsW
MVLLRRVKLSWLQEHARLITLGGILLLLGVFVPGLGARINGAHRWLKLGPLTFQPTEMMKLAVILYLADFLTRKAHLRCDFRGGFLPPVLLGGVIFLLIIVEPDFGTAALILMLMGALLILGGIRRSFLVWTASLSLPLVGLLLLSASYRVKRLLAFWDPWSDPQGKGYHVVQSMLALGKGGFWGVGIGHSNQKLQYLPSAYSDFIFSIVGEELGWLGAMMVLAMFAALLWLGWRIAEEAPDAFSSLLAMGITLALVMQAMIHIAVTTNAVPTKGIPLPFFSFGGSALVLNLAAVGILLRVADEGGQAVPVGEPARDPPRRSPGSSYVGVRPHGPSEATDL